MNTLARAPPALTHRVLSSAEGFCRPRRVAENKPTTERVAVMRKSTSVRGITTLAACALALAALADASSARAGTLKVTTLNDSGPGSLRQAIGDASPGDTITFDVKGTITLTSGALMIDKSLDIQGPGPGKLKISGNDTSRVFVIASGTVTMAGMTIAEGRADANSPILPCNGGGVLIGGQSVKLGPASLTLSHAVVSDNQALGDASKTPSGYPGGGGGGGVANLGTLTVTASSFIGNLARAGDGSSGPPIAGAGSGGGILNFGGKLTVSSSTFSHNQVIGGNECDGPIQSGIAIGGAIASAGVLVVSGSGFDHNQAIGGNGNEITSPDPGDLGPNRASGGAIDLFGAGMAMIDGCTLEHNQALGGAGASGANGGVGTGGGIVASGVTSQGVPVHATIMNCWVEHNTALGGLGGSGGDGGEGVGGGLGSISGATLTVISTTVDLNDARGGEGGTGGNGGNGLGGGFYENATGTLTLEGATVSFNLALGGEAEDGGSGGQGIGGGVYRLGIFTFDSATVIAKNHATTSNDNIWP